MLQVPLEISLGKVMGTQTVCLEVLWEGLTMLDHLPPFPCKIVILWEPEELDACRISVPLPVPFIQDGSAQYGILGQH